MSFLKKASVKLMLVMLVSQPVMAASLLQGTWQGVITNGKSNQEVVLSFNEQGYLLYAYLNKEDEEIKIPLDYQGQIVEYVPSGGGVASISVRYLEKADDGLSMTLDESFQKASNGYLQQNFNTTTFKAVMLDQGLSITQETAEEGGMSDAGGLAESSLSTVSNSTQVYVGLLQKNQ